MSGNVARQTGARLRQRATANAKLTLPTSQGLASQKAPSSFLAPWNLFKFTSTSSKSESIRYGLCRPGASTYIQIPHGLFSDGGANNENEIKVNTLHMNCQQWHNHLPVAFTSSATGEAQYVIFPKCFRKVNSLENSAAEDIEFPLHPKCRGAKHYIAFSNHLFYLIFEKNNCRSGRSYVGASTSSLCHATDWRNFDVPSYFHGVDAIMVDGVRAVDEKPSNLGVSTSDVSMEDSRADFFFRCGDARATGYYKHVGYRNGMPEYCQVDNEDAYIYWNSGDWISYIEGYKSSSTLYFCHADSSSVPVQNWEIEEGDLPAPSLTKATHLIEFTLLDVADANAFFGKLQSAALLDGFVVANVEWDMLTIRESFASNMPSVGNKGLRGDTGIEPDWQSLRYPVFCSYIVRDKSRFFDNIHGYDTKQSSQPKSVGKQMDEISMPVDALTDHTAICILRGATLTTLACDAFLQPVKRDSLSQSSNVISQCNISQHLQWLMARTKVRPSVHVGLQTRVPSSPHLQWALAALQRIRGKNVNLVERVLGVRSQDYTDSTQGLLDMLVDVGPRLQLEDEQMNVDSIETQLQSIVGLDSVKSQLRSLRKSLEADARRRAECVHVPKIPPHHMAFIGNPGVGKTTMARLVARILKDFGATKRGHLVEVQREDLVGQHVGSTAPKTRKLINAAKGGVLFIDEAYRLTAYDGSESRDFGPEAVEEIMKDLDQGDPMVIIAGYNDRIHTFFDSNPGLRRRFRHHFHFTNYTTREIAEMFRGKLQENGFFVEQAVTVDWIANVIADNTTEAWRADRNGCIADVLFDNAKAILDDRLCLEKATKWDLQTFSCDDLQQAAVRLQSDPKNT